MLYTLFMLHWIYCLLWYQKDQKTNEDRSTQKKWVPSSLARYPQRRSTFVRYIKLKHNLYAIKQYLSYCQKVAFQTNIVYVACTHKNKRTQI